MPAAASSFLPVCYRVSQRNGNAPSVVPCSFFCTPCRDAVLYGYLVNHLALEWRYPYGDRSYHLLPGRSMYGYGYLARISRADPIPSLSLHATAFPFLPPFLLLLLSCFFFPPGAAPSAVGERHTYLQIILLLPTAAPPLPSPSSSNNQPYHSFTSFHNVPYRPLPARYPTLPYINPTAPRPLHLHRAHHAPWPITQPLILYNSTLSRHPTTSYPSSPYPLLPTPRTSTLPCLSGTLPPVLINVLLRPPRQPVAELPGCSFDT